MRSFSENARDLIWIPRTIRKEPLFLKGKRHYCVNLKLRGEREKLNQMRTRFFELEAKLQKEFTEH